MTTLFCVHPRGFNIGNDAIHVALRHMLTESFGRVVNLISLPATSRFEAHGKAGLTAQTIHEINQYADGVIVGGGNLFENGQLDVDTHALHALEAPMLLFSLSRGRIYNRTGKLVERTDVMPDSVIRALTQRAVATAARDRATFEHLGAIGCDRVLLAGCPTITLGEIASRLPPTPEADEGSVLLSVRNPSLMNIPLSAQAAVRPLIERLIETLTARYDAPVRLLCHDHRDIPFAATFRGLDYVYTGDVYSYLGLLRSCRVNVTFRLHSALPCFAFGRPAVHISYDERARSALETVGMGTWDINMMDGRTLEQVEDRLERLHELPAIVDQARSARWSQLRGVMSSSIERFRDAVERYQRGTREQGAHLGGDAAWTPTTRAG